MRARIIAAAVLVGVALAVVASTASGGTTASNSITVWLQTDADKDNWKAIIRAATVDFQRAHPGVAVDVQFQDWRTISRSSTRPSQAATRLMSSRWATPR